MTLPDAVAILRSHYGAPGEGEPPAAFVLVLEENIAYLANDERRRQALTQLETSIGLTPEAILSASAQALEAVTAHGMLAGRFAEKLRECARLAQEHPLDGLAQLPEREAIRRLRRFPGIGEPAAEKILLLACGRPSLAPDSNALRVLTRLGLVAEQKQYAKTYSAAGALAAGYSAAECLEAHRLLRQHGQTLCRRNRPACGACPLATSCPEAAGLPLDGRPSRRVR